MLVRLLLFAFPLLVQGQMQKRIDLYQSVPNVRDSTPGTQTVAGYRLSSGGRSIDHKVAGETRVLLRLPQRDRKAAPALAGMLRHGAEVEVFLTWFDPAMSPDGFENHIEIFRGREGEPGRLVNDIKLIGGPAGGIRFFQPPDAQGPETVLIDVMGGSYWGTTYVLSPDRKSLEKLFTSSDWEFADLERNGVYSLIAWNRRPFDARCMFGIFNVRFYPEVFVPSGWHYRRVWPPAGWAEENGQTIDAFHNGDPGSVAPSSFQVVGGFADLNGDGKAKLIVLRDRFTAQPAQVLAVYELKGNSFHLLAETPLPSRRTAFLLEGADNGPGGRELTVRSATPERCAAGGNPDTGAGTSRTKYVYRDARLQLVR
jgi:hypothetical protein